MSVPIPASHGGWLGIDGCRGGWVWVGDLGDGWRGGLVQALDELLPLLAQAELALIDMPIGLLDGVRDERACDRQTRALLGRPRASSVFRPPCRAALAAMHQGYAAVCEVNRRETGVALSRQTFNIMPKLWELDRFLQDHPALGQRLRESHPELCLWWLNAEQPMPSGKRTACGRRERRELLLAHADGLDQIINGLMQRFLRRDIALDDAIDAGVLALVARQIVQDRSARSVPSSAPRDRHGLAMAILIPASDARGRAPRRPESHG